MKTVIYTCPDCGLVTRNYSERKIATPSGPLILESHTRHHIWCPRTQDTIKEPDHHP